MAAPPYTEDWVTGPESTSFYTRLYSPASIAPTRGLIGFIHGYNEHIGRFTDEHATWASRGFAVSAFDLRGQGRTALDETRKSSTSVYGRTGRDFQRMTDVEWAVKYAHGRVPDVPVFLMGQSMVSRRPSSV